MSIPRSFSGWRAPPRASAREPVPNRQWTTRVGEYSIHAAEYGSGEPLLLVHGLSGSARWWDRNVPELAHRYRVLVPDLIGFGRSALRRGRLPSPAQLAEVLAEWLRTIGVARMHLVGHSMGGQLAVHFATRFPERIHRLVLVDAAGLPRPVTPFAALRFAAELTPVWRWGDPQFLPVIVGDAWTAGPRTLLRAILHVLGDDLRPLLPLIQAPTLIVWGERDSWVPLEHAWELRRAIAGARLAVLRGASHNPMVDRPADFNRLVLRFLEGEAVGR